MTLSAEEKNTRMSAERAFLTKLLESAVNGNGNKLEESVKEYVQEHGLKPIEVLTQFKDAQKRTALHFACQSFPPDDDDDNNDTNEIDIVERILQKEWMKTTSDYQLILKQKDKDGLTPIMLAAQHSNPIVAEKRVLSLLEISKNHNLKLGLARSKSGATALHYASGAGATSKVIKELYDGANVALHTFSNQGGTPLHWAAAAKTTAKTVTKPRDYIETINTLIECGANVNAHNTTIPPPLVLAVASGSESHSKRLLQCETINIDETNAALPGTLNLFHMVADLNLVGSLAILLEKVPTTTIQNLLQQKNQDGLVPLDLAAHEGHVGCVLLLLAQQQSSSDTTPTEDDAKAYIEEYKTKTKDKTNESKEETKSQKKDEEIKKSSSTTPSDPSEDDAQKKALEIASLDDPTDEMKSKALEFKQKGNEHFSKKEWSDAYEYYTKAINYNPKEATFYSNRSACCLQLHRPKDALYDAVITRTLRPTWSKGCYRMAVARSELGRFEDAAVSAWEGLQQDQDNDELKRLLQKCVKKGRQEHQQQQQQQQKTTKSSDDTGR